MVHGIMSVVRTILIQLLIVVFIIELSGLFIFKSRTFYDARYLWISADNYRVVDEELWTYKPDSLIRKVAFYSFGETSTTVEYDCTFKTNKEGFPVSSATGVENNFDYVFLGASFVEGEGGCPWMDDELTQTGYSIYNAGLRGTGVANTALVYEHLIDHGLSFKNTIVLAVADEFFRTPSSQFYFDHIDCFQDADCGFGDPEWILSSQTLEFEKSEVARRAQERHSLVRRMFELGASFSTTVDLSSRVYRIFFAKRAQPDLNTLKMNVEALIKLKEIAPNFSLILVSQRDEVGLLGARHMQLQMVEDKLEEVGISWKYCKLRPEHYMPIDGHPNRLGQQEYATCAFGG